MDADFTASSGSLLTEQLEPELIEDAPRATPSLAMLFASRRAQITKLARFLAVGVVGLAVNFAMLWVLHESAGLSLAMASPIAILISMAVTFALNECWTWRSQGTGSVFRRMLLYVPINTAGLVINWQILLILSQQAGLYYQVANLVGAGAAAVWNFGVNNAVTWRS